MFLIAIVLNIFQFLMLKETGHFFAMFLQIMHESFCLAANLLFGVWDNPTMYVLLQVMVQMFIRIDFKGIRRSEK